MNRQIARALNADVILLADARTSSIARLENQLDYAAGNIGKNQLLGVIIWPTSWLIS